MNITQQIEPHHDLLLLDFRQQVLKDRANGLSYQKTADYYGISTSTIQKWETDISIKTTHNKAPAKIPDDALRQDVADNPDSYQYERAKRLGCSESGISHALKRLGISQKKDLNPSQSV